MPLTFRSVRSGFRIPGWTRFALIGVLSILNPACLCFYDPQVPPIVATNPATDIAVDGATLGGTIESFGKELGQFDSRVHVCISTNPVDLEPRALRSLYDSRTTESRCRVGSGVETVQSVRVTGLQPATTYSFVAVLFYGRDRWDRSIDDEQALGEVLTFTTLSPTPPAVSTGVVTGVTTSAATVSGTVTSAGSGAVTERGICYGTAPDPVRTGSCVGSGSGAGSFSAALTGLSPDTRYFARAFAGWSGGVTYGSSVEFTTLPLVQPGFTLAAESSSQLVERGKTGAAFGLSVTRVGGFNGAVTVSVTGLPTGVTANVQSPGTGNTGSVAFMVTPQAPLGTFTLALVGAASGLASQSLPFSLIVADPPGLTLNVPTKLDMTQGGRTTTSVGIERTGGWTGSVSLELHGLPAGITGTLTPSATTGGTSILDLTVASSVAVGSYDIEVRGTGSIGVSATATITINVAP